MVQGEKYRVSVLNSRLLRLEYQPSGRFLDEKSFAVVNRDFPEVSYRLTREGKGFTLETGKLLLCYDGEAFSGAGLSVTLKENGACWHFGDGFGEDDGNLLGTARTLDGADGEIPLEKGIFGRKGYAVLDDSHSPYFLDGELLSRSFEGIDLYFFGYGKDYLGGLRDFYHLCGEVPMLPRFVFGNWWSRYYAYSQEEYLDLMDHFEKEEIPLSVAVIDMDWHVTKVDPRFGSGWGGYTWNRELFPDYKEFLKNLKERKLHVTLNLHPSEGIIPSEESYPAMAKRLGLNEGEEKTIPHDFSCPAYREGYFEELLHLYEEDGVDFWWVDWQQGKGKKPGEVDPLILLNYFHHKDMEGRRIRPLIFSRYAGPGSHRYPIGFSGDTVISWESLSFQPYFTSTASNIGFGWWSHDIGGHMKGRMEPELFVRWVQLGVFSPVFRIHSSNSPFFNKEPWVWEEPYHQIIKTFMKLRHRLIPYLYTQMYRAHREGIPLVRPMYYHYPDEEAAYEVPREYFFGENLLVGAITERQSEILQMGKVNCLIPEGRWFDLFTGHIYEGRQRRNLYRSIHEIPVLLREGGIVTEGLEGEKGTIPPQVIRLLVGYGKDGDTSLYEDDGVSMDYQQGRFVMTHISLQMEKDGKAVLEISLPKGDTSLLPETRVWEILFYGVKEEEGEKKGGRVSVFKTQEDGKEIEDIRDLPWEIEKGILKVRVGAERVMGLKLRLSGFSQASNDYREDMFHILSRAVLDTQVKESIWKKANGMEQEEYLRWLMESEVPLEVKDALSEAFSDGKCEDVR